ncbi:hypothetical protein Nepgr_014362 [Nepenthes gracilis]|uniref:Uncharacterized protein n=1 Tax=Nepenthes gracilis TaxID=150966 RepID=A0AAD3SLK4_NEPGR|nr:hypothetical protein Nepgr_014362 [Nepenthes gracilis]
MQNKLGPQLNQINSKAPWKGLRWKLQARKRIDFESEMKMAQEEVLRIAVEEEEGIKKMAQAADYFCLQT